MKTERMVALVDQNAKRIERLVDLQIRRAKATEKLQQANEELARLTSRLQLLHTDQADIERLLVNIDHQVAKELAQSKCEFDLASK